MSPVISTSQPLQEPASTSRIATARPRSFRALTSTARATRTTASSPGPRGSVTRPTFRILAKSRTSARTPLAPQLAQHGLRADQLVVEDPPCHVEEVSHGGIPQRVPDRRALFAGRHDVLGAQHGELLGHGGLIGTQGLLKILDAAVPHDEGFQDANAERVGQGLEEFGLERLEPAGGARASLQGYIIISSYSRGRGRAAAGPFSLDHLIGPRRWIFTPPGVAHKSAGARVHLGHGCRTPVRRPRPVPRLTALVRRRALDEAHTVLPRAGKLSRVGHVLLQPPARKS